MLLVVVLLPRENQLPEELIEAAAQVDAVPAEVLLYIPLDIRFQGRERTAAHDRFGDESADDIDQAFQLRLRNDRLVDWTTWLPPYELWKIAMKSSDWSTLSRQILSLVAGVSASHSALVFAFSKKKAS
jgi:hypothetical protein